MNLPDGYFLQEKKYQLTHTIGQGGFGITYLGVWNTEVKGELGAMKTKVPVCIKEYFFKDYCYRDKDSRAVNVHSETGEKLFGKFKEKLIKEANILSAVHHPHIVNVLEVFEENNTAYIVMEYIKGCSLRYMLDKEGVLSENKVLKYVHQIGNALDFVHEKNIVHLDIKPGNILIGRDDNARLIDFGVSKRYDIEEQETSTTTLTLSKGFASIEQYDDEGTQNFSSCPDIYSLGATMYNLLTGVIPVESILRATKQMLPPSSYNSNITPKTEEAILKAMEVKPENRFQVVKELLGAIDIPPYELTENTLLEASGHGDDDHTEIIGAQRRKEFSGISENDDDRTVVTSSASSGINRKSVSKNKTKRWLLASAAALLCAFIGYASYSYFFADMTLRDPLAGIDMPGDSSKYVGTSVNSNVSGINESDGNQEEGQSDVAQVQHGLPQLPEGDASNQTVPNNSQSQTNTENNSVPDTRQGTAATQGDTEPAIPVMTKEQRATYLKEYRAYIYSSEKKMSRDNYDDAHEDLLKAQEIVVETGIMTLSEVQELLQDCLQKKREKERLDRLNEYDRYPSRSSDNLVVARKKSTGLYGAIHVITGEEHIKCIYATPEIMDGGLAFCRADGLYDTYDRDGNPVDSGLERLD